MSDFKTLKLGKNGIMTNEKNAVFKSQYINTHTLNEQICAI